LPAIYTFIQKSWQNWPVSVLCVLQLIIREGFIVSDTLASQ